MLHMPKPTNIAELKTALLSIWNNLPQEFTEKAIMSFRKKLRSLWFCVAAAGRHFEQWTSSLNTETVADIHYWNVSKYLRKSCAKFDSLLRKTYWICSIRLHAHLKKWTLKFKLLYLLNHRRYFNKICIICGMNPRLLKWQIWWM